MTIFQTKKDVDNLRELKRRKAELKEKIAVEKTELQSTMQLVRQDLKPANIVKSAVNNFLGNDKKEDDGEEEEGSKSGSGSGWGLALQVLTDVLIPNRKIALVLRALGPTALAVGPGLLKKAGDAIPKKATIYGAMRKKVAGLRNKLKDKEEKPALPQGQDEDGHIFI